MNHEMNYNKNFDLNVYLDPTAVHLNTVTKINAVPSPLDCDS